MDRTMYKRQGIVRAPGRRWFRPEVEAFEGRLLMSGVVPDLATRAGGVAGQVAEIGPSQAAPVQRADWTVMFYMTASNLEADTAAYLERLEQEATRLPGSVRLAVLYDQAGGPIPLTDAHGNPAGTRPAVEFATGGGKQAPWGGTGRAIVKGDSDPNTITTTFDLSIGEQDTGTPGPLEGFVTWAAAAAPANHYALVLVDHGGGIRGSNWDIESNSLLSVPGLRQVLADERAQGTALDLVAFSACDMGAAEVAYGLRGLSPVVVGSEDEMWTGNWDYPAGALATLESGPGDVAPQQLTSAMIASEQEADPVQTLSAIDPSKLDGLATALRQFTGAVQSATLSTADWAVLQSAREAAWGYAGGLPRRDLGQFMAVVAGRSSDAGIRSAASAVGSALSAAVWGRTSTPTGDSGLTIYFPGPLGPGEDPAARTSAVAHAYADHAAFDAATGWSEFLRGFVTRPEVDLSNRPPRIGSLIATPLSATPGRDVRLQARPVIDPDGGTVASVAFYRESDGVLGLQLGNGGDSLLGIDNGGGDGWWGTVPTTGLAPGSYMVYAVATDDGGALAGVQAALTLTNRPPVLAPLANLTAGPGQTIAFAARGADPDPGQMLTYSLDPGAPAGATIDPISGVFSWTPLPGPLSAWITVRVIDNGSPRLSDARSFLVVVTAPPPVLVGVERVYCGTGPRRRLIGVQLDFSGTLDPGAASDVAHFQVTQPGTLRGSRPRVVHVHAASYDPAAWKVKLFFSTFSRKPLTLTVTSLLGSAGTPMEGFMLIL
jgi:hypothetical protein